MRSSQQRIVGLLSVAVLAILAGCGSSSDSTGPRVAASISAVSSVSLSGTAGDPVSVLPSVLVRDAKGNPLAGTTVTFAVTAGGGSVTGAAQTTNAAGVATLGSWTLGRTAGSNTLTATAGTLAPVTFTATGAVGPAAVITKSLGDAQTARRSTLLPVDPAVTVTDANGNPVSGATVTFAIAAGGGSVSGATSTTNASGVATVGGWTLGATAGVDSLTAYAGSSLSTMFTATAIDPCATPTAYVVATTVSGQLESSDCAYTTGELVDFYSMSLSASAQAYLFQQSSSGFDTFLGLFAADGSPIAENNDSSASTTNSSIKVFLPNGNYSLGASSNAAGAVGTYALTSSVTTSDVANCETVFLVPGLTTTQNITSSDCSVTGPYYGDTFWIHLAAGQTMTVSMSSTAFDAFLTLYDASGTVVATNDNASATTTDAQIVYTAPSAGYYQIFANTSQPSQFGGYTLTVQ